SGFISPDNNDASAALVFELREEAGLPRRASTYWNVVPWYLGTGQKIAASTAADYREARPYLLEVLQLLPRLEVVVLLGKAAGRAWDAAAPALAEVVTVLRCPHPSPQNVNTRPEARAKILDALVRAA